MKLLNCPFCGSTKISIVTYKDSGFPCVSCLECDAELYGLDADKAWNNRTLPPKVQAVIDAAKKWAKGVNLCDADVLVAAVKALEESNDK